MAKIEQNLEQLFENNFDCARSDKNAISMSKEKFVEIVGNLLTECMANKDNSNCDTPDNKKSVCGNCNLEVEPIPLGYMCPECYCDM